MIPTTARRVLRGLEKEVPVSELAVDQLVLVKQEEYFPADGVITEGTTTVDEKSITGMDEPAEKYPSSRVYAGTRNIANRVLVRVSAVGENTIAHRIEGFMTRQAESRPNKKEQFLGFAAKLVGKQRTASADKIKSLAAKGIFIAGEETLKKLYAIDTLVFDKTGIITTGAKHVVHVVSFKPYTQQQVLNTAAAVEAPSAHLTAKAIVSFARVHGASALQRVEQFKEEGGVGVSGKLNNKTVLVGPSSLLQKKKIKIPKDSKEHAEEGETVIYVAADKDVLGYIVLNNPVKKNAKDVVAALKQHYRTVLLSGEHEETAAAIAKQVFLNEVVANVRNEERENKVVELRDKKRVVAYITALPASRRADVTITMGTRAAFSGDVTILHGNLESIQALFEEVRKG